MNLKHGRFFCRYPFKHAQVTPNDPAMPCCRFNHNFLDKADKGKIQNFKNLFKDIRKKMLNNEYVPGCWKCYEDEKNGNFSMRHESFELWDNDEIEFAGMEIVVGRLCNLRCVTCDSDWSNKWDSDAKQMGMTVRKKYVNEFDLDNLDIKIFEKIKFIKVTGGEPFLHRQFLNLIKRLALSGYAKQISLEIFTNCTFYPNKMDENALKKFKQVDISLSIDALDEQFEYLRKGADWINSEQIFLKWHKLSKDTNVNLQLATTVGILNVLYIYDVVHYFKGRYNINVMLQTVFEPKHLGISMYPDWVKDRIEYMLDSQFMQYHPKSEKFQKYFTKVKKMCKRTGSNMSVEELRKDIDKLADIRGDDPNRTFDRLWDLLKL